MQEFYDTCVLAPAGRPGRTHTTHPFESFNVEMDVVEKTNEMRICPTAANQNGYTYRCVDGIWDRSTSKKPNGVCPTDALFAMSRSNLTCTDPVAKMPDACRGEKTLMVDDEGHIRRIKRSDNDAPSDCSEAMPMTIPPMGRCVESTPEIEGILSKAGRTSIQMDGFCARIDQYDINFAEVQQAVVA